MDQQAPHEVAGAGVPVVFTCTNGDVEVAWLSEGEATTVRTFRAHFGHVVEVVGDRPGQLRRVGRGLRRLGSPLVVDAPLATVIERALADAPEGATADSDRPESDSATPSPATRPAGKRRDAAPGADVPARWLSRPLGWLGSALGVRHHP